MEKLEKGLKEVKELQPHRKNNHINQPDPTELPETKPPTKEYTWRDP
jgi:ribosomal protein S17